MHLQPKLASKSSKFKFENVLEHYLHYYFDIIYTFLKLKTVWLFWNSTSMALQKRKRKKMQYTPNDVELKILFLSFYFIPSNIEQSF